jgi:hypothetical protein
VSGKLKDLVWDHPKVKGTEKLLLLKLADWSNDEGHMMYPTAPGKLATLVVVTERRLRQMLQEFEEREWITVTHEGLGGGRGVHHKMRISLQLGNLFPGYEPPKERGSAVPSNAKLGNPARETRKSSAGNSEISCTLPLLSNQVLNQEETTTRAEDPSGVPFDEFWNHYPERDGKKIGRSEAVSGWERLSDSERTSVMVGVRHYRVACDDGVTKAMDAHRWLAKRRWEDWQTPAVPSQRRAPSGDDSGRSSADVASPAEYEAAFAAAEASENGWGI